MPIPPDVSSSVPATLTATTTRRASLVRLASWCASVQSLTVVAACGGGGGGGGGAPAPDGGGFVPSPPAGAPPPASSGGVRANLLNQSLGNPWGLAFLPDGRMLVTRKSGTLSVLSPAGATLATVSGVPAVQDGGGQGGLLDVAVDPNFAAGENWIYLSYAEAGGSGSRTAVSRGRLNLSSNQLTEVTRIFAQSRYVTTALGHYGGRLAFRDDGTLFITVGERQQGAYAQDVNESLGKVMRIHRDGSIPIDNPSFGAGARPGLWSMGHRNPQGAAIHPVTRELWATEHGPNGGDELNVVRAGQNYGWPNVSYGCNEDGPNCELGGNGGRHAPTYVEPVSRWPAPGTVQPYVSTAPAGMTFYSGSRFPEWQNNVFVAALREATLWRIVLGGTNGTTEVSREALFTNLGQRLRCIRQGPDGWLYLLTDEGRLYRIDR